MTLGSVFEQSSDPTVAGGRPDSRRDQWEGYHHRLNESFTE